MTLNVGQDFKKRWLSAPDAVRQAFLDDLSRVSDLLDSQSNIQSWLDRDQRAQQVAQLKIEQAYADEKARLIELARLRKQMALEQSLAEKRAQQEAYNQQLLKDELIRFQQQTLALNSLSEEINQQTNEYSARYSKNPDTVPDYSSGKFQLSDDKIVNELESLRLRLELEAETHIEEAVKSFREQLKIAASEEIEYILKNTKFDQNS